MALKAAVENALGEGREADGTLVQAELLCRSNDYPACIYVVRTRAKIEVTLDHFEVAEKLFQQVLRSARERSNPFLEANAFLDLSHVADEQTHFDEAIDWADAALKISLRQGFAGIATTATGNKGWAYYKLGDGEKGRQLITEAAAKAEQLLDKDGRVNWLTADGYIYMDENNAQKAEQLFKESLRLSRQIDSHDDILNALIALAFVSEQTNRLEDATHYSDQALAMAREDNNGRDVVYPLLVEGRIAAREHDVTVGEDDFRQVAGAEDTPVFLKWEAERSLARLYEDEKRSRAAEREYHAALNTFEQARCGLQERVDSRLPFLTNAARIYEDYVHFLVKAGRLDYALEVADYARARTLSEGLGRACGGNFSPPAFDAKEIAQRTGGTILFYVLGEEHSYLWAITPQQSKMFPLAIKKSQMDSAVKSYRRKLEGAPATLENSDDGKLLYDQLIKPAEHWLRTTLSKNNNVFIIPDDSLNSLNFETLLPQPDRYWVEDVTITNAASLHLLSTSRAGGNNLKGNLLLFGNPISTGKDGEKSYPELPKTAAQMEKVQQYFPTERRTISTGQQATPNNYLRSHPERFSYIHFVAHGEASSTTPLDSAIILSEEPSLPTGENRADSYKLYARDIINHPLHADLVTVSACYSAGDRAYSGEGLVGLSWAFLRAGAHNVVGALWDVSDDSTVQLIDVFYGEMKKGKTTSAALREAKMSLLHSHGPFRRPFYWAPFQLYTGS